MSFTTQDCQSCRNLNLVPVAGFPGDNSSREANLQQTARDEKSTAASSALADCCLPPCCPNCHPGALRPEYRQVNVPCCASMLFTRLASVPVSFVAPAVVWLPVGVNREPIVPACSKVISSCMKLSGRQVFNQPRSAQFPMRAKFGDFWPLSYAQLRQGGSRLSLLGRVALDPTFDDTHGGNPCQRIPRGQ